VLTNNNNKKPREFARISVNEECSLHACHIESSEEIEYSLWKKNLYTMKYNDKFESLG